MNSSMAKPSVYAFFETATMGTIYARGFLAVLVMLALVYACYQARQMIHALRLLDQEANVHRAKNTVAPSNPGRGQKGQSDYWR